MNSPAMQRYQPGTVSSLHTTYPTLPASQPIGIMKQNLSIKGRRELNNPPLTQQEKKKKEKKRERERELDLDHLFNCPKFPFLLLRIPLSLLPRINLTTTIYISRKIRI